MRTDLHWRTPSARLLVLRRVEVAGLTAVAAIVAVVLGWIYFSALLGVGAAAVAVIAGCAAERVVGRRFASWGYAEREDDLLVRRGVLFSRLSVVPYGRMQFVDVTAGPLERSFRLATVKMHTAAAASDARIPGLEREEAARLRDRLAELGEAQAAGHMSEPGGWRRLHPLSPIVRGGRGTIGIVDPAGAGDSARWRLGRRPRPPGRDGRDHRARIRIVVRHPLDDRRRRSADRDRGCCADAHCGSRCRRYRRSTSLRPGLARLLGVAELRLRMGGSTGGAARLSYVSAGEVQALHDQLMTLAHGARARPGNAGGRRDRRRHRPDDRSHRSADRVDPDQRRRLLRRGGARGADRDRSPGP